jgi:hypothetical protein
MNVCNYIEILVQLHLLGKIKKKPQRPGPAAAWSRNGTPLWWWSDGFDGLGPPAVAGAVWSGRCWLRARCRCRCAASASADFYTGYA